MPSLALPQGDRQRSAANAYVLPTAFRWTFEQENVVRFDLPVGSLLDDPGVSPTIDFGWSSRARWRAGAGNFPTAHQIQASIGAM